MLVIVKTPTVPECFRALPKRRLIDVIALAWATVAEPALPLASAVLPVVEGLGDPDPTESAGGAVLLVPAAALDGGLPLVAEDAEEPPAGDAVCADGEPVPADGKPVPADVVAVVPPADDDDDDAWPGICPMARAK